MYEEMLGRNVRQGSMSGKHGQPRIPKFDCSSPLSNGQLFPTPIFCCQKYVCLSLHKGKSQYINCSSLLCSHKLLKIGKFLLSLTLRAPEHKDK